MKILWIGLIVLFSLVVSSCGNPQVETDPISELPRVEPEIIPTENIPQSTLELGQTLEPTEMSSTPPVEKFVDLAKQDLASRLGIDPDRIKMVKSEEMLWLNAALGCPRPGVFYAQGRVPGFQIWLDLEGTEYIYNTDFNGTVVLCPELNPHAPNADTGPTPGVPIR